MARIAGVDLPRDKRVEIGLTYIFGIGRSKSLEILKATGINPDTRVRNLTDEEISKLREIIDREHVVEGDLRREVSMNIKRLIEIGATGAGGTGRDFPSGAREQRPMPGRVKAPARQ